MKKILHTLVIILAAFGVLFFVILLLPDDEEPAQEADIASEAVEDAEDENSMEESDSASAKEEKPEKENGNTAKITIPKSQISDEEVTFQTTSLDNKTISQEIFSDYDLTIVHVWGTYCSTCIAEMGDYAALDKSLPDNVNLVAIVSDVYDGMDSGVSDAQSILKDAGADFLNLRTSEELSNVTESLQYVPSSFFVDKDGHIVGEILDGAGFDETRMQLDEYME